MSQSVTMRLPDETVEWLKTAARRTGRSVSDLGATLFEEARRTSEFAEIEFRSFGGERQACLKGSLRLWKVILSAKAHDMNAEKAATNLDIPVWKVQAALHYYEAFPEEIDAAIADAQGETFNTLKRRLPRIEQHVVEVDATAAEAEGATNTEHPV